MVTDVLLKYIQNAVNPNQEELESWKFEKIFIPHYVSRVICNMFFFFFLSFRKMDKVVELVGGGSVINDAFHV